MTGHEVLDLPLPESVERVGTAVEAAGGRAFVVGGSVRDHLLGIEVKDWDIEVHGVEMRPLEKLLRRLGRVNAVGRSFGVFKLAADGGELDISIPRRDNKVGPGHRGISVQGDPHMGIEEAVRRRDLTINAMMVHIPSRTLHDPAGGRDDIANRLMRAVDDTTFLEDPLRAVRAVQFTARFGFDVHADLEALCRRAPVDELPPERILGEMAKLFLRGRKPSSGLALLRRTGLGAQLFPERVDALELDLALDRVIDREPLRPKARQLARAVLIWLADTPTADAVKTLDRLGLYRYDGTPCREPLLAAHAKLDASPATDADLRHLSTHCEVELLLTAVHALHPERAELTSALERAAVMGISSRAPDRLVQGRDLIALGMQPGPRMGPILAELYRRQLDGELMDRDTALQAAREAIEPTNNG